LHLLFQSRTFSLTLDTLPETPCNKYFTIVQYRHCCLAQLRKIESYYSYFFSKQLTDFSKI
jgi:hypothetical protein